MAQPGAQSALYTWPPLRLVAYLAAAFTALGAVGTGLASLFAHAATAECGKTSTEAALATTTTRALGSGLGVMLLLLLRWVLHLVERG